MKPRIVSILCLALSLCVTATTFAAEPTEQSRGPFGEASVGIGPIIVPKTQENAFLSLPTDASLEQWAETIHGIEMPKNPSGKQLQEFGKQFNEKMMFAPVTEQDVVLVESVTENSPADYAGIKAGDHIIDINGQSVVGLNLIQITALLFGDNGSFVSMTLERKMEQVMTATMKVSMRRVNNSRDASAIPDSGIKAQVGMHTELEEQVMKSLPPDSKRTDFIRAMLEAVRKELPENATDEMVESKFDEYSTYGPVTDIRYFAVEEVIADGPAAKAGIQKGDHIVKVNGRSTMGKEEREIIQQIKGYEGTTVSIAVVRPGTTSELTFTMTREPIEKPAPQSPTVQSEKKY